MKYTTFRWVVRGGVAAVGVGIIAWIATRRSSAPADKPAPVATEPAPVSPAPPPTPPPPPPQPARAPLIPGRDAPLREMDRKILALVDKSDGTSEKKNAVPGGKYKVNLYQDAGEPKINRVKVDLNGNGKWDEKWSRDGDTWKRRIAPKDDEVYTTEVVLRGERWVGEAAEGAAPGPAPAEAPKGVLVLRPGDQKILERIKQPLGDKGKNAVPESGWKVNLYQDAGKTSVNRLRIDLDGDGRWDEKWTIDGGEIKREVAPAHDERYTEEWRLRGGVWVRK
ncbi:MAG TPA: hypothetical protein VKE22_00985 [Haliangiales bacterium]|nr:hypothetical protein [Haliangiales bacterium]